jgi:hypothetical protein
MPVNWQQLFAITLAAFSHIWEIQRKLVAALKAENGDFNFPDEAVQLFITRVANPTIVLRPR